MLIAHQMVLLEVLEAAVVTTLAQVVLVRLVKVMREEITLQTAVTSIHQAVAVAQEALVLMAVVLPLGTGALA